MWSVMNQFINFVKLQRFLNTYVCNYESIYHGYPGENLHNSVIPHAKCWHKIYMVQHWFQQFSTFCYEMRMPRHMN